MKKENRPVIGVLGVPTHDDEAEAEETEEN